MKNLILTFVFALVALVSVSQVICEVSFGSATDTTINVVNGNTLTISDLYGNDIDNVRSYNDLTFTGSYVLLPIVSGNCTTAALYNDTLYLKVFVGFGLYSKQITVNFADGFASVSENTLTREELKVYPSPATSETIISFFADRSDMVVNIFSLNGQLVYQDDASREVGVINVLELDVSEWLPGVYIVRIGNSSEKLIIE